MSARDDTAAPNVVPATATAIGACSTWPHSARTAPGSQRLHCTRSAVETDPGQHGYARHGPGGAQRCGTAGAYIRLCDGTQRSTRQPGTGSQTSRAPFVSLSSAAQGPGLSGGPRKVLRAPSIAGRHQRGRSARAQTQRQRAAGARHGGGDLLGTKSISQARSYTTTPERPSVLVLGHIAVHGVEPVGVDPARGAARRGRRRGAAERALQRLRRRRVQVGGLSLTPWQI